MKIKCVVYECQINAQGLCLSEDGEISPNTLLCKKIQCEHIKRYAMEDTLHDRMVLANLREAVNKDMVDNYEVY